MIFRSAGCPLARLTKGFILIFEVNTMRKRILLTVSVLMLFGLAIAAYAYTTTTAGNQTAMSCCKDGGSCPMKNKDATTTASCCDDANCCCNSADSCPMKNHDNAKHHEHMTSGEIKHDAASMATHGEGCGCPCCAAKKDAGA